MAKRKRLSAPSIAPETKGYPLGVAPTVTHRPPIAQVSGDASALAAAESLAAEVTSARASGRLVVAIPLDQIAEDHLLRDRLHMDSDEMTALMASIRSRGQQTPIEVIETAPGRYGLISGLRRLTAIRALFAQTSAEDFATIKALIKPLDSSADAYIAMVEENEIRADLSFYERGQLAVTAAEAGVFDTPALAIKALFANATPARRSKIASFVQLHQMFGNVLRFPVAVPEKVGLALVKAGQKDKKFVTNLHNRLLSKAPATPEEEREILNAALMPSSLTARAEEIAPGVTLAQSKGRVVLAGRGVTPDLVQKLRIFLAR